MKRAVWWLAVAMIVVGCGGPPPLSSPPPVAQTAEEAANLFLSALVDGRKADAEYLMTPEALAAAVAGSWLADGAPLSDIVIERSRRDGDYSSRYPQYTEVRQVYVTFYLDDFSTRDGFSGGDTWWGFMVAGLPDGTWKILSAGVV